MAKKNNCPQCKKALVWSETNDFRPFCSERCRLIDLGAWATGRNKIKGSILMDEDSDIEEVTKH